MATEKKKKQSFLLYLSAYTSGIKRLSFEDKGKILDALFYTAGSEVAENPNLSPMLELAFCPLIDCLEANAKKYEAKCEANRAIGASGGRKKAENAAKRKAPISTETYRSVENIPVSTDSTERYRKLAFLPNTTVSTETYHEYDNEYELTTTAKDNLLTNTKLCSIGNRATESYRTVENLPDATERYDSVDQDAWPPDCDRAEAFGGDLEDDSSESDDSEEDRPF